MKPAKLKCQYCGRPAVLQKASYVYGDRAPEEYVYVCSGYPECNAYVNVHRGTFTPMGTLANGDLRHMRIKAHRTFSKVWESGIMTKNQAYRWMRFKFALREDQAHIGQFSEYMCGRLIEECSRTLQNNRITAKSNMRRTG